MKRYNFEYLTWLDFENLSRDVVEAREHLALESFSVGRDKGIDFRRIYDKKRSLVVQCKHYKDYKTLYYKLKNDELPKVKQLQPSRYILIASVNMTSDQKEKIVTLFNPYIVNPLDVICASDIEQEIDKNEHILRKNHKLWLTSSKVLELVLQKKIIGRSNRLEIDMKQKVKLYVETADVGRTLEILDKNHYGVISGAPGVGKTTLAQILSLYYVKDGFQLAYVTNIDEAEDIINEDTRQIIYYDDFLGNVKFSPYKNEDKRLVNLLRRVQASKKTKLIMTTREYIIRQARSDYEELDRVNIDISKVTIELSSYTTFQRAHILYNHLYYSSLDKSFIENILLGKGYEKIIHHKNYNPRLIEAMTTSEHFLGTISKNFTNDFINLLDNPAKVWERAFEKHISQLSRALLYVLFTSPAQVSIADLEQTLHNFIKIYGVKLEGDDFATSFNIALKELDGTFIRIDFSEGERVLEFANPSIIDFLTTYIKDSERVKQSLITSYAYLEPLLERFSLVKRPHSVHVGENLHDLYIDTITNNMYEHKDVDIENPLLTLMQLDKIYNEYKGSDNKKIKEFLLQKVRVFEFPDDFTDYHLATYLSLVIGLNAVETPIIRTIIVKTLSNVDNIDDLKKLATLHTFYEEELFDIALQNTIDLPELFSETVDSYSWHIEESSPGELDVLIDDIQELEIAMGYDLSSKKELISEAIALKNFNIDDLEDIDRGEQPDTQDDINDLFDTLIVG